MTILLDLAADADQLCIGRHMKPKYAVSSMSKSQTSRS